jgi:rod shape-determining protein MreD
MRQVFRWCDIYIVLSGSYKKGKAFTMVVFSTETKIWLIILSSFFGALMLMLLHLPNWVEWIYPQWLVLLVLYWSFTMPQRVNVGVAWLAGFFLDILYNAPIGEHALALVLAVFFITKFRGKIELLYFWKKAAVVFCLIIGCQLLPLLMQFCLGSRFYFWPIFSQAIISTLVWLIVESLFNYKRKLYLERYY